MNWYKEVCTLEALGVEYDLVLGKYKADRLKSSTELLKPKTSKYSNVVVEKNTNLKLYDVTTDIMDDGQISLFARIFGTVNPYKVLMSREHFAENYIVVTGTGGDIKKMLKDRKKKEDEQPKS